MHVALFHVTLAIWLGTILPAIRLMLQWACPDSMRDFLLLVVDMMGEDGSGRARLRFTEPVSPP